MSAVEGSGAETQVTREELIERALDLAPRIAERAEAAEELRNVPDDSMQEMLDAGLFRMLQPRRVGGYEMPFDILVDVLPIIGAACTSTAWILGNFSSRNWNIGMWPKAAQDEIWGAGPAHTPDVLACSAYVFPALKAFKTNDGYLLNSSYPTPFSSGVDLAEWNTIACMLHDESGAQDPQFMQVLLHRSEYKVLDTWYASGLVGSGSKDVLVENVEIPEHRGMLITNTHGGPTPGSEVNPGPLYRLPVFAAFGYIAGAPGLGCAMGALASARESLGTRIGTYGGQQIATLSSVQVKFAEAAAAIDTAEMLYRRRCEEMMAIACAGEVPSQETRAVMRRDSAYGGGLFTDAVDLLVQITGAAGLYKRNPMQRYFRDVHALAQHAAMVWDVCGQNYGQIALGGEPALPMV
ncbi:MAG: acyl-CoA dehydrogenase family protein [Actinomycetota bacterium]|jgi:3-hydroxy-9,10-secoandrosta-1,3,5(10)-triene-9,17-dione monooxygenase|nr:acyl-CoA dehydrogenase family protein [Actinomycetota bacterium]